jgi:hypothetical protein
LFAENRLADDINKKLFIFCKQLAKVYLIRRDFGYLNQKLIFLMVKLTGGKSSLNLKFPPTEVFEELEEEASLK